MSEPAAPERATAGSRQGRPQTQRQGRPISAPPSRPGRTASAQASRLGRPPVHQEAWTKVTVVLLNRQIVFLDRVTASIRAHSGTAVSRAQLIRSIIDAVAESGLDLTAATSERELKHAVLARLGGRR